MSKPTRIILVDQSSGYKQFFEIGDGIDFIDLKSQIFGVLSPKGRINDYNLYHTDDIRYTDISQFRDGDTIYLKPCSTEETHESEATVESELERYGLKEGDLLVVEEDHQYLRPHIWVGNRSILFASSKFDLPDLEPGVCIHYHYNNQRLSVYCPKLLKGLLEESEIIPVVMRYRYKNGNEESWEYLWKGDYKIKKGN